MKRRTKIVATVGPASDSPEMIAELIDAGVDVFRLGTAHDPVERVLDRMATIRGVAEGKSANVGILVDLAGPKVRAGFGDDPVELVEGSTIKITGGEGTSTAEHIVVNVDQVEKNLVVGDVLHMGDGSATLVVTGVDTTGATAIIERGGVMRGRPGVHIPSSRLSELSPTKEDIVYFDAVVDAGADMVAISFVKTARDLRALGAQPVPDGPLIIAKIETQAAVDNLTSILEHCGGVMVARGDLGLECSLPGLPFLQKKIISESVHAGKPVITATQMLESMTTNSQPTRAEVTDVANAVFDGTSAVMLSGETAVGHDPVLVIQTMAEILAEADGQFDNPGWAERVEDRDQPSGVALDDRERVAKAMRSAGQQAAEELASRAIVAITGTGATARMLSRYRPHADIVTVSPHQVVVNQLCLSWGVTPIVGTSPGEGTERIMGVLAFLRDAGLLKQDELVPLVAGASNSALVSNVLRIEKVP